MWRGCEQGQRYYEGWRRGGVEWYCGGGNKLNDCVLSRLHESPRNVCHLVVNTASRIHVRIVDPLGHQLGRLPTLASFEALVSTKTRWEWWLNLLVPNSRCLRPPPLWSYGCSNLVSFTPLSNQLTSLSKIFKTMWPSAHSAVFNVRQHTTIYKLQNTCRRVKESLFYSAVIVKNVWGSCC